MTLIYESWEIDLACANEQIRVDWLRSDEKNFEQIKQDWIQQQKQNKKVVQITKCNIEPKQNCLYHNVWLRPDYNPPY